MKITRTKVFWLVWAIIVFLVLWWFAHQAAAAQHIWVVRPAIRSPKGEELAIPARIALPRAEVIPKPEPDVEFFAATAYNADGESDFSNEISFTNNSNLSWLDLAWDPVVSTTVPGYRIYAGWYSRQYDRVYEAGTNLWLTVPLYGYPLTNVILTATTTNGGLSLSISSSPYGPWMNLNTNFWKATNPPSPLFFRGLGLVGNRVLIWEKRF